MIWGFVYGAKYGLVGSLNDFLGTNIDVLNPDVLLASIANINTWEYAGYNMLIFYSSLSTIPHSLYEAASIDGASEWQIVKKIKLPELKGSLAITVIFSIIGSFQLFNEPSILQNMVPGNAISRLRKRPPRRPRRSVRSASTPTRRPSASAPPKPVSPTRRTRPARWP